MHIDVVMPAREISEAMTKWLDSNLPLDIQLRRGNRKGEKVVCFSVYGTTQENIMAKWEALERLISGASKK